jgi:hypothetical protein
MQDMKTYDGWLKTERAVRQGERAQFYLVSPDGTKSRAVFTIDQTDPWVDVSEVWTEIVPANERPSAKAKEKRLPVAKIRFDGTTAEIWVGPHKPAIALLKKRDYHFDRNTNRWVAKRSDVDKLVAGFEQMGFRAEVELLGHALFDAEHPI